MQYNRNLSRRTFLSLSLSAPVIAGGFARSSQAGTLNDDTVHYRSSVLVPPHTFTSGVEGPACDGDGNLYAVNYQFQGTIGIVSPDGTASLFADLPSGSTGNGIRIDSTGDLLVADYTGHNILRINRESGEITVHAHESAMNQPNDIAITSDNTLYASDPNWSKGTGNIWRIKPDGSVTLLETLDGTTNGIEVSPDEKTLYVNLSSSTTVLAYDILDDGTISNKRELIQFQGYGTDGMRCDESGNLYVTRIGGGHIAVVSPEGDIVREIETIGANPTNIAFGGADGRTCFVTLMDQGNIETFRVEIPGRSWRMRQDQSTFVADNEADIPAPFRIGGIFPNPFNAVTTIDFSLTADTHIECSIYNMIGQKVTTIANNTFSAGRHLLRWEADGMPSGVYIARIRSAGYTESVRMTLMK